MKYLIGASVIESAIEASTKEAAEAREAAFEPIQGIIDETQKRAKVRLLRAEDIVETLIRAEKHLLLVSSKKDAFGTEIKCDVHGQHFPSCYNGRPESTHFSAKFTKSGWAITAVWRSDCECNSDIRFTFTEATKKNMAKRLSRC